ncbi:MAG: ATPase, T2SS/T4P/T4SS family [Planctomycetota bacterium]|jgi:twitching motility protein PilT
MAIKQTEELERALQAAADRGDVSAVLLVPNEPMSFRVDGQIERTDGDALSPDEIRDIAAAALGEECLSRVGGEVSDAMTSCALPGVVDGRLCVVRTQGSYSIVIRILPRANLSNLAETIGAPCALIEAAFASSGLVIVSGPARSGKTTTQYALLSELNKQRACHICTVEYVIAMHIPAQTAIVQQREIGIDIPDCIGGIRASVAQGADVLMVGEIRSAQDLEACIRVGYLGRLVITQLHVPTPEGAVARMIQHVDETTRQQLARSLRAVAAQHLIPAAGRDGHVAAFGLLIPDDAMRQAIVDGRDVLEREAPLPEGCRSLRDDIARLLREGAITDADARDALTSIG